MKRLHRRVAVEQVDSTECSGRFGNGGNDRDDDNGGGGNSSGRDNQGGGEGRESGDKGFYEEEWEDKDDSTGSQAGSHTARGRRSQGTGQELAFESTTTHSSNVNTEVRHFTHMLMRFVLVRRIRACYGTLSPQVRAVVDWYTGTCQ